MAYPTRLLSDDEVIEAQFRPHWSGILREGLVILVGIALAVLVAIFSWPAWVYAAIAGLVVILVISGIVRWVNTLHVVTNERLIYRAGFIAKQGTEIPLEAALALDAELQQELFQSEDAREGLTAFNAKREPRFVGR